jgi:hypothetical protein
MKFVLFVLCTFKVQRTKKTIGLTQSNKMKFRLLQFRFDGRFGVHRAFSEISPCVA